MVQRLLLLVVLVSPVLTLSGITCQAQQIADAVPGLGRLEGVDPENQVAYTRIFLAGTRTPASQPSEAASPPPVLTAQCTMQPNGKQRFELSVNFDGAEDHTYHRPWMPKDGGLFPPVAGKAVLTMEFLGYTHVKPVKRQWEILDHPAGELRYNPPGMGSTNIEEIAYYLQYLKSLPTLRLSYSGRSVEFRTAPLLRQLHLEPLCRASGL